MSTFKKILFISFVSVCLNFEELGINPSFGTLNDGDIIFMIGDDGKHRQTVVPCFNVYT